MHFADVYAAQTEIPEGACLKQVTSLFSRKMALKKELKIRTLESRELDLELFLNKTISPGHIITEADVSPDLPNSITNKIPPSWKVRTTVIESERTKGLSLCNELDKLGIFERPRQSANTDPRRTVSKKARLISSSLRQSLKGREVSILVFGLPAAEAARASDNEKYYLEFECSRLWKYE